MRRPVGPLRRPYPDPASPVEPRGPFRDAADGAGIGPGGWGGRVRGWCTPLVMPKGHDQGVPHHRTMPHHPPGPLTAPSAASLNGPLGSTRRGVRTGLWAQGSREAGKQGSRGSRGAGKQGSREAGKPAKPVVYYVYYVYYVYCILRTSNTTYTTYTTYTGNKPVGP